MIKFLFKGKRIDNDEWVEGYYVNCVDPNDTASDVKTTKHFIVEYPNKFHEVYTSTICVYIGLDKDKRKIFTGDIFEFDDEIWESSCSENGWEMDSFKARNRAVIGYDPDEAQFDFIAYQYRDSQLDTDIHENHDKTFAEALYEATYIGNIFDDPEKVEEI